MPGPNTRSLYAMDAASLTIASDAEWLDSADQPVAFRAQGAGVIKVTTVKGTIISHPVLDGERVSLAIKKYFSTSNGSSGITGVIVYFG